MDLPLGLQEKIGALLDPLPKAQLQKAAEDLSLRYRERRPPFFTSEMHYMAYLATRLPATYAVLARILESAPFPDEEVYSIADWGAGAGVSSWVWKERFPLASIDLIEKEASFVKLGRFLNEDLGVNWISADYTKHFSDRRWDLTMSSYSLNELSASQKTIERMAEQTDQFILLIEPGTPKGYQLLLQARERLISLGWHLMAPCPHQRACPLPSEDWCHFSARLPRSKWHRQLKGGELSYEDEKFFYILFSKKMLTKGHSRILRHPYYGAGWARFSLCGPEGLSEKIVSKKQGELYKIAKKAMWGDCFFDN